MDESASVITETAKSPSYWVAVNMRTYRHARGYSQDELAAKLGWVKQVVSTAEATPYSKRQRKLGLDETILIAEALGVTLDDLMRPVPPCVTCANEPPKGFTCNECGRSGAN